MDERNEQRLGRIAEAANASPEDLRELIGAVMEERLDYARRRHRRGEPRAITGAPELVARAVTRRALGIPDEELTDRDRLGREVGDAIADLLSRRLKLEPMDLHLLSLECTDAALRAVEAESPAAQAFRQSLR